MIRFFSVVSTQFVYLFTCVSLASQFIGANQPIISVQVFPPLAIIWLQLLAISPALLQEARGHFR